MGLTLIKNTPALERLLKTMESATANFSDAQYNCAVCSDLEWVFTDRGAKQCECLKAKIRSRLLGRIPAEYAGLDLATVEPDASRHISQSTLIRHLRNDPGMSVCLFGKVGSGKSLLGWLLYRRAVEDDRPAVALSLAELLGQYRRFECGSEELPVVTSADLREDKRRHFIFLDEFDKARATEFACEQLFLLLDAIYANRHQLIVASNLNKDALRAHWSQASEQYGASIMRRMLELDGMARKEMF